MALDFAMLYGSVREDRQGIKAALFIKAELEARGHMVTLIDAQEHPFPLLDRMYKEFEPGEAPDFMDRIAEMLKRADGFVIVSGEYNHGIPPALKNMLDHYLEEWFFRPSGIVSYSAGVFGGVRAAMQLRMTLAELGMPSIPSLFPVPRVQQAFEKDGTPVEERTRAFAQKFLDELVWYAEALKAGREKGLPY
ncbi:MAG: NAD(P)H-dependent oxidoreductase [Hyphomicrobiales bacterium]|nr:NAD(P)H-dependent oxidoreductase [Hyphomicrobiales bacterium]